MMGGMGGGGGGIGWQAQMPPSLHQTDQQHDVHRQQQFFHQQQQIQNEIRMQQEQIQQLQAQLQNQMQQMMLQSSSGGGGGGGSGGGGSGGGAGMGGNAGRNAQQMQQQQQQILQTQMQLQQMQSFPAGGGLMNPQLAMQQQDQFFASSQHQQHQQPQQQRQRQPRQQQQQQQPPRQRQTPLQGEQTLPQTNVSQPAPRSAPLRAGTENGRKAAQPTPTAAATAKSAQAPAAKKPASGGWASIVASNRPSVPPPKTLVKGKTQSIHRKQQVMGNTLPARMQQSLRQKQTSQPPNRRGGGGAGSSASSAGGSRGGRGTTVVGSGGGGKGKERFVIKVDTITKGKEKRTTLMIQNIPNKYSRQMLLDELNDKHRHCYDFLYLPIDFRNKCNLGYAFINMITPADVVSLHNNLRGQSWKQSRSEKKADVKWGRLQGKRALVEHFRASSFLKRIPNDCRPICFYSSGAKKGQVECYIGGSGLEE
jgi:hypothetical protein